MHASQFNPSDVTLSHRYRLSFSGKYCNVRIVSCVVDHRFFHTEICSRLITIMMYLSCWDRFPALNFPQLAYCMTAVPGRQGAGQRDPNVTVRRRRGFSKLEPNVKITVPLPCSGLRLSQGRPWHSSFTLPLARDVPASPHYGIRRFMAFPCEFRDSIQAQSFGEESPRMRRHSAFAPKFLGATS
jgi:hypothetical protein